MKSKNATHTPVTTTSYQLNKHPILTFHFHDHPNSACILSSTHHEDLDFLVADLHVYLDLMRGFDLRDEAGALVREER